MTEFSRRGLAATLGGMLAAALVLLILAAPAAAQTMTNNFGGFSRNSGEPIDIESDVLVVHDAKKYATFKGNVKAVQGSTTLRARELDVHYVGSGGDQITGGGATQPAGVGLGEESGTQISQIEARGNVIINSDKDQTTTSDWALYDVPTQMVTVGGNVVLTQGRNVLKGDRLIIDLKTGESRFENQDRTVAGGRIRALFVPGEEKAKKKGDEAGGTEGTPAEEIDQAESAAAEEGEDDADADASERKAEKAAEKAEKKAAGEFDRDPASLR
jgi:lipopolysaccharide export system protein LptA